MQMLLQQSAFAEQFPPDAVQATHTPFRQICPPGQPTAGSQAQAPLEQVPLGQVFPHVPQLVGSVCATTQTPPQQIPPAEPHTDPSGAGVWVHAPVAEL
ncbi:MAG TPA: hypothetical protein VFN57_00550 [Thermomicrobiaceae bacterium]|nr:hypothetical protein [Thermomicrobiaceae bacterium]